VVDGARVTYRAWGTPGRPGLILVHGGAANAAWWDHIGPLLTGGYRVVAIDLSGHGDSDRRERYVLDTWADEVLAVARAAGIAGPPLVIGHSMGGWVTLRVGANHSDSVAGIVVIDSAVSTLAPEEAAASRRTAFGPLRTYPSVSAALPHFRTVPDQPTSLPYVIDHVARNSLRPVEGGWVWKFDPAVFGRDRPPAEFLRTIRCRVAVFRAEYGLNTPDIGADMYELLGRRAPVIEIPQAGHHVMLDQPLPLVTAIRTLLADWNHSHPIAARAGAA
jgi:pimeloyl-ACP methyl ester carboxylesterase